MSSRPTDLVNQRLHILNQTGLEEGGDFIFADMFDAFVEKEGKNLQVLDEDWDRDFVERRHCVKRQLL